MIQLCAWSYVHVMGMVLGFAREQPEVLFEEGQGGREGRTEAARPPLRGVESSAGRSTPRYRRSA
jgi:hypothetical protein